MTNDKKGGRREGAGRKSDKVASIHIKIPQDIHDILSESDNKTEYVCESIRYYHRKKCTKKVDNV